MVAVEDGLAATRRELERALRSRAHYVERCDVVVQQVEQAVKDSDALRQRNNFRPGRHVTQHGGYTLALARNEGHAGGVTTAQMVSANDLHDNAADRRIVWQNEHRAVACVRAAAHEKQAEADTCEVDGILATCDGTSQDAIQKRKVHTSLVSSYALIPSLPGPAAPSFFSCDEFVGRVRYKRAPWRPTRSP